MVLSSHAGFLNAKSNPEVAKVLVTAPPLVNSSKEFEELAEFLNFDINWVKSSQVVSEADLLEIVGDYDGWIIGDDPCTRKVLQAGKSGSLKAIVKWGVGVDNLDLDSIKEFSIRFSNTPNVFGKEVADLAVAYLVNLSRQTLYVHNEVMAGRWIKPLGISLENMKVALIGLGNIGQNVLKRLTAADVETYAYEVDREKLKGLKNLNLKTWPVGISEVDAIIFTCSLSKENYKMLDRNIISELKRGSFVINVSRGGLISERDLEDALINGQLGGAALDVYDTEPLPSSSRLKQCKNVILGSHNASNTIQAVKRASEEAFLRLNTFFQD